MIYKLLLKEIYVQLCTINILNHNLKYKHVTHKLSSWKILTEWTHNLNHINAQFKTKQSMFFLKQRALKICAEVEL